MVKFGPVVAEIFGGRCRFLPFYQKGAFVTLLISGITGPIFIKIAGCIGTVLPLNTFESKLP